jgi:hypothetical protein
MELATDLLKNILIPQLEKDFNFENTKINDSFLDTISLALITFENDAKPLYTIIYSLELEDAEKIISKIPVMYSTYIKELAEQSVLGYKNTLIDKLIENKNETFLKEVLFFKTMEAVIIKSGRQQLKKNLPQAYDRLVFELDEKALESVAKKKSREDFKAKFKQWDEELIDEQLQVESEQIMVVQNDSLKYSLSEESNFSGNIVNKTKPIYSPRPQGKVISISWIKYAVAACVFLTAGVLYIKLSTNTNDNFIPTDENSIVTAPVKKDTPSNSTIPPEIPSEALAEVTTVTKTALVIESGLGFASKNNNIKIVENNQKARMQSIVIAIDKYRQFLENEFSKNKEGVSSRVKELEFKINSLQKELTLLKQRENQYVFDGNSLVLYVSTTAKENTIILYEDNYFLKRDADFYRLSKAVQSQNLKKLTDSVVEEELYNLFSN